MWLVFRVLEVAILSGVGRWLSIRLGFVAAGKGGRLGFGIFGLSARVFRRATRVLV